MPDLQTLFPDVGPDRIAEASKRFFHMDREAGDVIVEEGDVHDAMFIIESGLVKVTVGGFEVAELGPGACIGEIGLFTTSVRTATVVAASAVSFHLLSRPAFHALRESGNPVAAQIERRAIGQLAARLRQLVSDIRIVGPNARGLLLEPVQTRQTEGQRVPLPEAAVLASLQSMAAFGGESADALAPVASLAATRTFQEGDTMAALGRRDGPLQLLVSGRVDCLVTLEVDQILAATLSGGELFNVLPFVDGQPRPVSYVAAEPCTVLTLEKGDIRRLVAQPGLVASAIRTAMIRSLSDRVNQLNATFSLAKLTRLEVDSGTPMPAPSRAVALPPEAPPEPGFVPPPVVARPTPMPEAPPEPGEDARMDAPVRAPAPTTRRDAPEAPGFDPRTFVQPAPLGLGRPAQAPMQPLDPEEGTPWFDSESPDWDTWFELTDEVSL